MSGENPIPSSAAPEFVETVIHLEKVITPAEEKAIKDRLESRDDPEALTVEPGTAAITVRYDPLKVREQALLEELRAAGLAIKDAEGHRASLYAELEEPGITPED